MITHAIAEWWRARRRRLEDVHRSAVWRERSLIAGPFSIGVSVLLAGGLLVASPVKGSVVFPHHVAASCQPYAGWILYKDNWQWVRVYDWGQQKYTNVNFQLIAYQDCTTYNYQLRTYVSIDDRSTADMILTNHGEICNGSTCQTYYDGQQVVCTTGNPQHPPCSVEWVWENGYISLYPGNWGHGADDWGPGYDGDQISQVYNTAFSPHLSSLYMTISVP